MSEFKSNKMLARFGLAYGPPSKDPREAVAFLSEFARLLSKYDAAELEAAADKVIVSRKFRTWPTIGDAIAALEDARADSRERNLPEFRTAFAYPDWSHAAVRRAAELIRSSMGERAAREGWIVGLHDYCRKNGRLPWQYEIGPMIDSAEFVARCAAGAEDMGVMHKALMKLGQDFLVKRERLAQIALGAA